MDPHLFLKLDPDPNSPKKLDPDLHKVNADPKHRLYVFVFFLASLKKLTQRASYSVDAKLTCIPVLTL
jgi:hypothetical protein